MRLVIDPELAEKLAEAKKLVQEDGIYFNYKSPSHLYRVLMLVIDEATRGIRVVYKPLYGPQHVWDRTLENWLSLVHVGEGKVPRFQKIAEDDECMDVVDS